MPLIWGKLGELRCSLLFHQEGQASLTGVGLVVGDDQHIDIMCQTEELIDN